MHGNLEWLWQSIEQASALAYSGAGADLSLISAAIGLFLTLGSSVFFLILWPVRVFWRRLRGQKPQCDIGEETAPEDEDTNDPIATDHRKAA